MRDFRQSAKGGAILFMKCQRRMCTVKYACEYTHFEGSLHLVVANLSDDSHKKFCQMYLNSQ